MLEDKHEDILNKDREVWNRIKDLAEKGLDIAIIHNEKYLSTKIKSYEGKMETDFHDDGLPLERTPCGAHSII